MNMRQRKKEIKQNLKDGEFFYILDSDYGFRDYKFIKFSHYDAIIEYNFGIDKIHKSIPIRQVTTVAGFDDNFYDSWEYFTDEN